MSKEKRPSDPGRGRDLQELLTKSIAALRASPEEREKYPALDHLLTRIEAHERGLPGRAAGSARGSTWRWLAPLAPPLSAAAAGFAGAALALLLLPGWWFAGEPQAPPVATRVTTIAPAPVNGELPGEERGRADTAQSLSQSIHRLERAIRGLENFQPLVESRIEWVEDALQRKHADAYAPAEDKTPPGQRRHYTTSHPRKGNGV